MPDTWTVPGYTHVRELGTGGSGRVVLAVDDVTQTQVVVKYLRPGAAPPSRYKGETEVLARIEDPNLVQFYEYAEGPGGAAAVTEFVDGVSLRRVLAAEGGTVVEAALSMLSGSLLGLAALHDAGIAHRALKPENVLIAAAGTTKLSNAGVGDAPAYLAPERQPGPAADLYSATMMFVECLTGMNAVPEPFRRLVEAGLSPDPAARPASAAAFLTELDDISATAYGEAWESTGRARLAEHAARAAAYVPLEPPRAQREHSPVQEYPPDEWEQAQVQDTRMPPPKERTTTPQKRPAGPPERTPVPPERAPWPAPESAYGAWAPINSDPVESGSYDVSVSPRSRRSPGRLTIAATVAVIVALGITWYVLQGRDAPDDSANARSASPGSSADARTRPAHPPATAGELVKAISKAVAARHTASFSYRGPGVAAQGALKFTSGAATAYDMKVTPLRGGHPDRNRPIVRVILVGAGAYVQRGGWKPYSAATLTRSNDAGQQYATLATSTRLSSSVYNVLALLRSSQVFRRVGLTYRGVAQLAQLSRDGTTVAELYRRVPPDAVVAYTIEMAQNSLPRQLTMTISAPDSRRTFRTIYTGWGRNASIAAPR